MARRMATELKMGFAGVMLATSLTRLRLLIATFNAERAPSWPSGCWGLPVMVGVQGKDVEVAQREA